MNDDYIFLSELGRRLFLCRRMYIDNLSLNLGPLEVAALLATEDPRLYPSSEQLPATLFYPTLRAWSLFFGLPHLAICLEIILLILIASVCSHKYDDFMKFFSLDGLFL